MKGLHLGLALCDLSGDCQPAGVLKVLAYLDRSQFIEVIVKLRENTALEFKLRSRFRKFIFTDVYTKIRPRAWHRLPFVQLLCRSVSLLDPLPNKSAEAVVGGGAIRVILANVQNKFIVTHLNPCAHCSPLLHSDVESDVKCLFKSPQQTRSQVIGGVGLKVEHSLA